MTLLFILIAAGFIYGVIWLINYVDKLKWEAWSRQTDINRIVWYYMTTEDERTKLSTMLSPDYDAWCRKRYAERNKRKEQTS